MIEFLWMMFVERPGWFVSFYLLFGIVSNYLIIPDWFIDNVNEAVEVVADKSVEASIFGYAFLLFVGWVFWPLVYPLVLVEFVRGRDLEDEPPKKVDV